MDAANRKAPERSGGGAYLNNLNRLYGRPKDTRSAGRPEGIDGLLSRLDRVRQTGTGRWIARCPAHDDNRPSLHVTLKDDGAILIHCFSHQCAAADIVAAVGLSLTDLFPAPCDHHRPAGKPRVPAADVLSAIVTECWIVAAVASDVARGSPVDDATARRVALAGERIQQAARLGGVPC